MLNTPLAAGWLRSAILLRIESHIHVLGVAVINMIPKIMHAKGEMGVRRVLNKKVE